MYYTFYVEVREDKKLRIIPDKSDGKIHYGDIELLTHDILDHAQGDILGNPECEMTALGSSIFRNINENEEGYKKYFIQYATMVDNIIDIHCLKEVEHQKYPLIEQFMSVYRSMHLIMDKYTDYDAFKALESHVNCGYERSLILLENYERVQTVEKDLRDGIEDIIYQIHGEYTIKVMFNEKMGFSGAYVVGMS